MTKLWQKDAAKVNELIERFTVGRDQDFDLMLAPYDVEGSMAHAKMLAEIGMISAEEAAGLQLELGVIMNSIKEGKFSMEPGVEDVHSQVEFILTEKLGDAGKKIHSGRSRNDQVAVDIKLYLRAEIRLITKEVKALFDLLISLSEKHRDQLLPGYTHLQIAMPSSFGLWFGAFAESLTDDLEMLGAAFRITNKNPLGSGAGYGSSFPLNRQTTTRLLQFAGMNYNSVYAQMTRGKTEKATAMGMSMIAATLSKLSMDCCLYMNQNFGFISFPDELTTGSSIMPHKKNPDVFELIRAKCNRIQSLPNELTLLINNLPSGYHRDMQLTKEILFPAIETLKSCLEMMMLMLTHVAVKENILADEKYKYLFSVEAVNERANQGLSFREAYREIGKQIQDGNFSFDSSKKLQHTHQGSIGNLSTADIVAEMTAVLRQFS